MQVPRIYIWICFLICMKLRERDLQRLWPDKAKYQESMKPKYEHFTIVSGIHQVVQCRMPESSEGRSEELSSCSMPDLQIIVPLVLPQDLGNRAHASNHRGGARYLVCARFGSDVHKRHLV